MSSGGRGNLSLWFVAEDRRATHEGKNGLGEGLCHKSFYRFLLFVRLNIKERVFFFSKEKGYDWVWLVEHVRASWDYN